MAAEAAPGVVWMYPAKVLELNVRGRVPKIDVASQIAVGGQSHTGIGRELKTRRLPLRGPLVHRVLVHAQQGLRAQVHQGYDFVYVGQGSRPGAVTGRPGQ